MSDHFKVKLSFEELLFIIDQLPVKTDLKTLLKTQKMNVVISEDNADYLRDLSMDKLETDGFNEKYEPNVEGVILESLIDKFFTG